MVYTKVYKHYCCCFNPFNISYIYQLFLHYLNDYLHFGCFWLRYSYVYTYIVAFAKFLLFYVMLYVVVIMVLLYLITCMSIPKLFNSYILVMSVIVTIKLKFVVFVVVVAADKSTMLIVLITEYC